MMAWKPVCPTACKMWLEMCTTTQGNLYPSHHQIASLHASKHLHLESLVRTTGTNMSALTLS
eukprot:746888-Hanusia_phi.AAC.4